MMDIKEQIADYGVNNDAPDLTVQMNGVTKRFTELPPETFEQTDVIGTQKEQIVVMGKPDKEVIM